MSRKLFSLIVCLVLVLGSGVVPGLAQEEDGGEFVISPTGIQPPDGSVDIYVPLGDSIIIRSGWGACTRGLAQAWTKQNKISLWVNGEPVFSSPKEAQVFWGEPESFLLPDGSSCVNDVDSGWRVYWEYSLGELAEGTYIIHYEENVDHPFLDGGDYDGDGQPDINEYHVSVDFNIIVTEMGSISGTITEEGTGEPIEGIFVFACEVDVYCDSTLTDNNGFYKISLPIGAYRVGTYTETDYISEFYDDKIYWEEADDVFVFAGEETPNINFTLLPAGIISGRVMSEYGDPLPGLWVDACEYDSQSYCASAETDDDGYYSILLPPGEYWVQVYVEQDWIGQAYDVDPQDGEPDRVPVLVGEDTAGIDFELLAAGSISGRVTSAYGDPLPGLWVDACEYDSQSYCGSAETDDDGYYTILLPPGEYWVQVFPETDWIGQMYDADQDGESDRMAVTVGEDTAGVDFQLLAAGMISGWVTDDSGEPVVDIWVDSCEESVSEEEWGSSPLCNGAATDENGFYTITALQPGNYRVVIWGDDVYVHQFFDHQLNYNEADLVEVEGGQTAEDINFDLILGGSISGWVKDEAGDPIVGIWVSSSEESVSEEEWGSSPFGGGAGTDENGFYTITALQPGNYRVVIWGDEVYLPQFFDHQNNYDEADLVGVEGGQTAEDINFDLILGGTISGTVYEADGMTPIPYILVTACSTDYTFCNGTETGDTGEYTITGLPPEMGYRVFIWQPGWVGEFYEETIWWEEATIVSPDATGIDFTLEPGGSISGFVTDIDGNPLSNIGVDIMDGEYGVCTDENGYYSIMSLPFGTYDIVAGSDFCGQYLYVEQVIPGVTIDADNPDISGVDFELAVGGSISGAVIAVGGSHIVENIDVSACFEDNSFCGWTSVQSDGTYEIIGLPAGDYRVHAYQYPGGYWVDELYDNTHDWDAYTPVSVTAGVETAGIDFWLELGGAITGVVKDGNGNPLEGLQVSAGNADFFNAAMTNANGEYWIFALPPGDYDVFVFQQDDWVEQHFITPVSVTAGQDTANINFSLEPGGSISGIVTDVDGNHIPERIDVSACLVTNPSACFWTTVQEDDTYSIIGLPSGEFLVNTYEVPEEGVPWGYWIGYTYPTTVTLGVDVDVVDIDFMLSQQE